MVPQLALNTVSPYNKIPVVDGAEGFKVFTDRYPNFNFCPYIAEKDAEVGTNQPAAYT